MLYLSTKFFEQTDMRNKWDYTTHEDPFWKDIQ